MPLFGADSFVIERRSSSRDDAWPLLAALQTLRAAISLRPPGREFSFSSLILEVDQGRGTLVLDAAHPSAVNAHADILLLDAQVEGRRLVFRCRCAATEAREDGLVFIAVDPEIIVDEQRRAAHRVAVPPTEPIKASITTGAQERTARVLDISRRGIGATLPASLALAEGLRVQVRLSLPDLNLKAEATVRYHRNDDSSTRVGLEFSDLPPTVEAALTRAIFRIERETLRRRRYGPGSR